MTQTLRMLAAETGAELTTSLRAPEFVVPTLALPMVFYLMFGVMLARSADASTYLLATYGIFAVMGPSLFGFGVGVASERERGWLELKRAAPTPVFHVIGAKLIATVTMSALALAPIYAAAGFLGDVALPRSGWFVLLTTHLLAVVPFSLLGLAIGFVFASNAAVALANIAFLGLAILGGLWFPLSLFPGWLAGVAALLPSFHLAEVSLSVVDPAGRDPNFHLAMVGVSIGVGAMLAGTAWSRQRRQ